MKFYEFRQSNPGGHYEEHMPMYLYVQAPSSEVADAIAEQHGIYFDGVAKGLDCNCCNDRWDRASDGYGSFDTPPPSESEDVKIIYACQLYKELS